jgi:hypothetical protein
MIFFPTVGADPLSDGIKAAATIRAEDRCDGESRLFLSGNIFHKDCVDAVSAFLNLSIIFIIIDPPGSDGHVHLVSFQPEFVQAEAVLVLLQKSLTEMNRTPPAAAMPRHGVSEKFSGLILRIFCHINKLWEINYGNEEGLDLSSLFFHFTGNCFPVK